MANPRSFKNMVDQMNLKTYGTTNPGMLPVIDHRKEPEIIIPPSKESVISIISTPSGKHFDWAKLLSESSDFKIDSKWRKGNFEREHLEPATYTSSHARTTTATAGTCKMPSAIDLADSMKAAMLAVSGYNSAMTTSIVEAVIPLIAPPSDHPDFGSW